MLTAEDIEQVLGRGHEMRGFELKGPGLSTDKQLFAKVVKASLGLGNLRDGGHVIIGIDDTRQHEMLPGLNADELASWLAFDDVARWLANYADPPLRFGRASRKLSSGITEPFSSGHLVSLEDVLRDRRPRPAGAGWSLGERFDAGAQCCG